MSICPDHQVERVMLGGHMQCPEHRRQSMHRYDVSEKGRERFRRYTSTPGGWRTHYWADSRYRIRNQEKRDQRLIQQMDPRLQELF